MSNSPPETIILANEHANEERTNLHMNRDEALLLSLYLPFLVAAFVANPRGVFLFSTKDGKNSADF